jgi:nucleoside-diphosphate-sugar epimerase
MKNVLIIGGNRFVGKMVTELLSTKCNVTILNRSGTKSVDNCNVLKMDRDDISQDMIDNQDVIIDMCAYNVDQVKDLLKLCSHRHQYIVISSIASEYGFFGDYGKNKAEIEKFLRFETDTPNTIIRPTYIIGKGDHHKRIDYFLDCIKNKCDIHLSEFGDKKLSFVFKEDVAEVIYEVVVNGVVNKTYNICNDEDVTMMELIELFFKITQDKTTIKTLESDAIFKDEECIFSNELVKQDLGIEFKTLEDGIREYILSKS